MSEQAIVDSIKQVINISKGNEEGMPVNSEFVSIKIVEQLKREGYLKDKPIKPEAY